MDFELQSEEVIEHSMFDLVERSNRLSRNLSQTNPHQYGAGDVVALGACLTTLATLNAGQLPCLTMKLPNLPAQATRILCGRRTILSQVVGDDPVRAVCGHLYSEQFHFMLFRKALYLDRFAMRQAHGIPFQRTDVPVRECSAGVVDQPVLARDVIKHHTVVQDTTPIRARTVA